MRYKVHSVACATCGKEFVAEYVNKSNKYYCSKECRSKKNLKVKATCEQCGKSVWRYRCHMDNLHNFCSRACRHRWMTGKSRTQSAICL